MSDPNAAIFDEMREEVVANGSVLAVRMERLRDAAGAGRLGKYVVQEIDAQLRRRGLNHTPLSDNNAWTEVLIYMMGGEVERIIEAVQHPSDHGAATLRAATSENESAADIVRQIRALVEVS